MKMCDFPGSFLKLFPCVSFCASEYLPRNAMLQGSWNLKTWWDVTGLHLSRYWLKPEGFPSSSVAITDTCQLSQVCRKAIYFSQENRTPGKRPFNTTRVEQNGRYFVEDIFKCVFFDEKLEFRLKCHSSLIRMTQLTSQYWFRWWLGVA